VGKFPPGQKLWVVCHLHTSLALEGLSRKGAFSEPFSQGIVGVLPVYADYEAARAEHPDDQLLQIVVSQRAEVPA